MGELPPGLAAFLRPAGITLATFCIQRRDWGRLLGMVERRYRLRVFELCHALMTSEDFWFCLSEVYVTAEEVDEVRGLVWTALTSDRPRRDCMMSGTGAAELANMPETFTIYRGFAEDRAWDDGFSFTTDRRVAVSCAKRSLSPMLFTGTIRRANVSAFLDQRDESEILALPGAVTPKRITSLKTNLDRATACAQRWAIAGRSDPKVPLHA